MIKDIKGDLIALAQEGAFDVIAHGCNCQCAMGAGIAKGIKAAFPAAFAADLQTPKGDRKKLGTCSQAACATKSGSVTVVNAYTQFDWRGAGTKVDYDALQRCMRWMASQFPNERIGMPRIGAGLAGGDWARIRTIIADELGQRNVTIVEFDPQQ